MQRLLDQLGQAARAGDVLELDPQHPLLPKLKASFTASVPRVVGVNTCGRSPDTSATTSRVHRAHVTTRRIYTGPDVRRTEDLVEFATRPGRYLVGDGYVCFHRDERLYGFALWGDHDERTISRLMSVLDVQLAHAPGRHIAVSDLARLGTFEVSAYVPLAEQVAARAERLGQMIEHQVMIRPAGAGGLMVAGFYGVVSLPYRFSVVATAAEAADALADPGVLELFHEVDAIIADVSSTSVLSDVRSYLRTGDLGGDIGDAARALGVSARTLQRRLQDAGTSFRAERVVAQLERAKNLLLTSDDKVTAIAVAVGFTSLANFSAAFQKATGEAPTTWRARRRR